jgi:hypothetical protein
MSPKSFGTQEFECFFFLLDVGFFEKIPHLNTSTDPQG